MNFKGGAVDHDTGPRFATRRLVRKHRIAEIGASSGGRRHPLEEMLITQHQPILVHREVRFEPSRKAKVYVT